MTARVWDLQLDRGTLSDWERIAERSPFVLDERGVLVRRFELRADAASSMVTHRPAAPSK